MKRVRKSKTIGVNVLGMLALFIPQCGQWLDAHPREALGAVMLANILLRFVSKDGIQIEIPGKLKGVFRLPIILLGLALMLGASNCKTVPLDPMMSATEGGDQSVILAGYGAKSQKGYLFAQAHEGAGSADQIQMLLPTVSCRRESCIRYQWFRKSGDPGHAGSVPKGFDQANIPIEAIIGHPGPILKADDGEYSVLVQVFFDNDGQEYSSTAHGFLRLNVLSKGFTAMSCGDPNTAWSLERAGCQSQFTSKLRSVVCGQGCGQ